MKITRRILFPLIAAGLLTACHSKEPANVVKVGTIAGPETKLMLVAAKVAEKRYGLKVIDVVFQDYVTPNEALADGSLDANAFQHVPFLNAQVKAHGFHIVPIGKTFVFPMGAYSKKIHRITQLKPGAKIAIPNDPSNEARALLLLQKYHLIRLKPNVTVSATPIDIASNPKHFKFIELDAAQLPRSLQDVTLAVINNTYAVPAGLSLHDALFAEGPDSLYTNIFAARTADRNSKKLKELVKAYQSKPVAREAKKIFGDGAIPGWK